MESLALLSTPRLAGSESRTFARFGLLRARGSTATAKEHRQKEAYASPGLFSAAGGFLTAGLFERTYSVGWAGKVFEVQMDVATIQKLSDVLSVAASAFSMS